MNEEEFEEYKISLQGLFDVSITHLNKWGVKQEMLDRDQQKVVSDMFSIHNKRMDATRQNINYELEFNQIENIFEEGYDDEY